MRLLLSVALLLFCALAWGQAPQSAPRERERIARERAAVNLRFDAAQRDCQTRFIVVACIDQAKAERRAAIEQLAQEQAVIDNADRRQRAAERLRRVQEKSRRGDAKATAPVLQARVRMALGSPPVAPQPVIDATAPSIGEPTAPSAEVPLVNPSVPERQRARKRSRESAADAARRAEHSRASDKRMAEAAAHRQAVVERNARRAAVKPPAAPLPVPDSPR